MMPFSTMSTYSSFCASKANVSDLFSTICDDDRASTPEFSAICRIGASSAFSTMLDAGLDVVVVVDDPADRLLGAQTTRTPPPGTMPSSTAARVALSASSTRSFFSFHLDLGRAADADDRNAARQLRETLLQLLTVVVRGGLLDLRLDLADAGFDVLPSCRRRRRSWSSPSR